MQAVTFDRQLPGYDVELVHAPVDTTPASGLTGGGGTAIPLDVPAPGLVPPPEVAVPLAVPVPTLPGVLGVEPEQVVIVVGWQRNPSPQSASALQGSCQR